MKEFFINPICKIEADSEAEATEKIYDLLTNNGIEIRGWK